MCIPSDSGVHGIVYEPDSIEARCLQFVALLVPRFLHLDNHFDPHFDPHKKNHSQSHEYEDDLQLL